ncbi:MAG: hypothetical protein KAG84_07985, partial [Bacteroidales bacterium]|nr:hypothetical protein [Bacteroidales bacterium]
MRLLIIILSIIMPVSCAFAQFTDDFSDGNFTNNPIWDGDVTSFEINNSEQLHLKTINADTAILYTSSTVITNSEWRFFIKQSFNSSNNNHTRVYLASNNSDLKSNLNGYYIQIGSTNDNICLWRQDGDIHTKLIDGTNMSTGGSVNKIFIKAIC